MHKKAYRDILLIANGHEVFKNDLSKFVQNIHHIDIYSGDEHYLNSLDSFKKNRLFQGYAVFGIFLLLVVQTLFNISVNIGLLPTKGLTLPFISYGGTSIIIMLSLIGIVLRINNENKAI